MNYCYILKKTKVKKAGAAVQVYFFLDYNLSFEIPNTIIQYAYILLTYYKILDM